MPDFSHEFRGWTYRRLAEWASRLSDHELDRKMHRDGPLASLWPHVRRALKLYYDERARLAVGAQESSILRAPKPMPVSA